jgi:hypothetical protein
LITVVPVWLHPVLTENASTRIVVANFIQAS